MRCLCYGHHCLWLLHFLNPKIEGDLWYVTCDKVSSLDTKESYAHWHTFILFNIPLVVRDINQSQLLKQALIDLSIHWFFYGWLSSFSPCQHACSYVRCPYKRHGVCCLSLPLWSPTQEELLILIYIYSLHTAVVTDSNVIGDRVQLAAGPCVACKFVGRVICLAIPYPALFFNRKCTIGRQYPLLLLTTVIVSV